MELQILQKIYLFIQILPHSKKHGDKASGSSDKVGYGLGKKYAVGAESGYGRQPQRERNDDDNLAEQGKEHSLPGFAKRHKR